MASQPSHNVPQHVAIIMDGNGRWAKKRFLARKAGHAQGAQALRKLAEEANKLGVRFLSVYAFSTENWRRSPEEVNALMDLLRGYIQEYIDDTKKNDMRVKVIGRRDRLPADLVSKIDMLERITAEKPGLCLVIGLDYGGRDEIVRAAVRFAREQASRAAPCDEDTFAQFLDTANIPDPELLIRTSGEQRLSNFLPWQAAYAELYFTDKLWPDFKIDDLTAAIAWYNGRNRRFGGRGEG